jgi:hypothetical protein
LKTKDDAKKAETEINLFSDNNGRVEANVTQYFSNFRQMDAKCFAHGNGTFGDTDMNDDGFLDRPKGSQLNVAYLLNYNDLQGSGFGSHFGINYLKDERTAGQIGFNKRIPQKDQSLYGVGIDISRFQVWNKTGYVFKGNLIKVWVG